MPGAEQQGRELRPWRLWWSALAQLALSRISTAAKFSGCSSPIRVRWGAQGRYRGWGCALGASYEGKRLEQEGRGAIVLKPIKEFELS